MSRTRWRLALPQQLLYRLSRVTSNPLQECRKPFLIRQWPAHLHVLHRSMWSGHQEQAASQPDGRARKFKTRAGRNSCVLFLSLLCRWNFTSRSWGICIRSMLPVWAWSSKYLSFVPYITWKSNSYRSFKAWTFTDIHSKYLYRLRSPLMSTFPLEIGSPFSINPYEGPGNCKFCCPVLFQPAHCELHFHLRKFIPKEMKYCAATRCQKYTKCENKGYSDSHEYCGQCGVSYRRRYERGRRVLDQDRRGPMQHRLKKVCYSFLSSLESLRRVSESTN